MSTITATTKGRYPCFRTRVAAAVRAIPLGETATYGEVAARAGSAGAARAVGTLLSHNHDNSVPCHRVVPRTGGTGRYNRGEHLKRLLLSWERFLHVHSMKTQV